MKQKNDVLIAASLLLLFFASKGKKKSNPAAPGSVPYLVQPYVHDGYFGVGIDVVGNSDINDWEILEVPIEIGGFNSLTVDGYTFSLNYINDNYFILLVAQNGQSIDEFHYNEAGELVD